MEILLVRGEVRPGSRDAFLETSARYNDARESAGLPRYRRCTDTTAGGEGPIVFICEFADAADIDRAEHLLESNSALKSAVAAMYEHLVPGSVTATTLRDLD